ncbi:MAG: phosphoribosyltransferase family protein [bacterium]
MKRLSFYTQVVNFLFPINCILCGRSGAVLCEQCFSKCTPTNTYTLPKNTLAIFSYKDKTIRHVIKKIKYNNRHAYTESFGRALYELITEELADKLLRSDQFILCPIPLSNKKNRVHNHAQKIAEAIAKQSTTVTVKQLLTKRIQTKQQAHIKNKHERITNMHGVFDAIQTTIKPGIPIVIVDDVITTGATMTEAMRVLKKHYGKHRMIIGVAIAH